MWIFIFVWANMQICTSPADLPPILRWAFWSSKNSLVAVRSETRFSSSAILFLSWWFSSWIWRKCPVDPSPMSEKSYHHVEGVRWGSPKNFWRTIHVSQAPGNLPISQSINHLTFFSLDRLFSQTCHPPPHQNCSHCPLHSQMDAIVALNRSGIYRYKK